MKLIRMLGVVALAVGGVACGDSEPSGALLTVADLGPAWAAESEWSIDDAESLAAPLCPDTVVNPDVVARLRPTEGAVFSPVDGSLRGIMQYVVRGEAGRLAMDLEVLVGSLEVCMGEEFTVDEGESVLVEPFPMQSIGDEVSAFRMTVREPPDFVTTWYARTAYVRMGGTLMAFSQFDIVQTAGEQPPTSDADFVDLVTMAVELLNG